MASESSVSTNSLKSTQGAIGNAATPACNTCKDPLKAGEDTQKNKAQFFKNCKSCRDKDSALRRKKRTSYSFQPFGLPSSGGGKKRKLARTPKEPSPPPPPTERECTVCADSFQVQDFPSLSTCAHEPDVCHTCFLQWLSMQIDSTTWERIACPASGCGSQITHDDVKTYAPADVFARSNLLNPHHLTYMTNISTGSTSFPCAPSSATTPASATASRRDASPAKSTTPARRAISFAAVRAASAFARYMT